MIEAGLSRQRAPTHPGVMLLEEFLEPLGITQKEFDAAKRARKRSREVTEHDKMVAEDLQARQLIEAARAKHNDFTRAAKADLHGACSDGIYPSGADHESRVGAGRSRQVVVAEVLRV